MFKHIIISSADGSTVDHGFTAAEVSLEQAVARIAYNCEYTHDQALDVVAQDDDLYVAGNVGIVFDDHATYVLVKVSE